MAKYSELLYILGAMVIYSLLVVNVNAMILKNQQTMVTTEVQHGAVSVAQDVINEVQWMNYNNFRDSNEDNTEDWLENLGNNPMYNIDVEILDPSYPSSHPLNGSPAEKTVKVTVRRVGGEGNAKVSLKYIKTDY